MSPIKSVSLSVFCLAGSFGSACMGVTTFDSTVSFGWQQNIIVWDEVTKTEHFFRRASFDGSAADFGFIAPTPSIPEIGEADAAASRTLAVLERRAELLRQRMMREGGGSLGGGSTSSLQVIQDVEVGDFQATTLKSTDAEAMAKYLEDHGYVLSEAKREWVEHYVRKEWYLTAFRVKKSGALLNTSVIRMSFPTEHPFNPYYVPKDNLTEERAGGFHTFFISKFAPLSPGIATTSVRQDLRFSLGPSAFRIGGQLGLPDGLLTPAHIVTTWSARFSERVNDDLYFRWDQ